MTYGSETWTLYHHHIKLLRTVQQHHLRSILKITNNEVLDHAKSADIEIILIRNRLYWMGHVARMSGECPMKALLYGELAEGTRRVGCPLLRLKDTLMDILKRGGVLHSWRNIIANRPAWRALISKIIMCIKIENDRWKSSKEKRGKCHERATERL